MNKRIERDPSERRENIFLAGLAIIISLLMWQACVERITLARSSYWATILLLEFFAANLIALAVYVFGTKVAFKSARLNEFTSPIVKATAYIFFPVLLFFRTEDQTILARVFKLFFGLVAVSVSIAVEMLLLSLQRKYLVLDQYADQYKLTTLMADISVYPFAVLAILYAALILQPLLNSLRSGTKIRGFVFISGIVLALVPLISMLEYHRSMPMFELGNSYDWFKNLRGPRVPPPNDLVVVSGNIRKSIEFVRAVAACHPRKIVIIPDSGLWSDEGLAALDGIQQTEGKILVTSWGARNIHTKFKHLEFAELGQWTYFTCAQLYGEDDSLTAAFRLARDRNSLKDVERFSQYVDEHSDIMYEPYSRWGFVRKLLLYDRPNGWNLQYVSLKKEIDEFDVHLDEDRRVTQEPALLKTLPEYLEGKTLIVDFSGFGGTPNNGGYSRSFLGLNVAATLMNIEQNDFIRRLPYYGIAIIAFFALLGNLVLYYRLKPWNAFGSALLLNVVLFAGALVVYAEWSVLVYVTPIFLSIGIFTLAVFPYELVRERSRQIEERTRLSTELKAAHDMQMGLMPKEDPKIPG